MRSETTIRLSLYTLMIGLMFGLGCSTLDISSDWDTDVDFSEIESFAWIGPASGVEGADGAGSLLDQRIRRAVAETLGTKGLREVERQQADVLVSYHIGIESKLDIETVHRGYGYGYGGGSRYSRYGPPGGYTDTRVTEYDEGTFLLDLIDPERMELVWRGSAQSRIYSRTSPEEREARVREVVGKVLGQYPPED
jgi:Domain of unknown function (DUF4136)